MSIIVRCVSVLLGIFFSSHLFANQTKAIDNFWHWFEKNQQLFYVDLTKLSDKELSYRFNKLQKKLTNIKMGLVFEFGAWPDNNGVKELIISADGNKTLFPFVEETVAKAPKIKHWQFIPFRQKAKDIGALSFSMSNHTYTPNDFKFAYKVENDQLNLGFIISGKQQWDKASRIALELLIDSILGERDNVILAEKIANIDLLNNTINPPLNLKFHPLSELPMLLDKSIVKDNS